MQRRGPCQWNGEAAAAPPGLTNRLAARDAGGVAGAGVSFWPGQGVVVGGIIVGADTDSGQGEY